MKLASFVLPNSYFLLPTSYLANYLFIGRNVGTLFLTALTDLR